MTHNLNRDQLRKGVRSILAKSGYSFSEEDKALLEAILIKLDEMTETDFDENPERLLKILSLLLRFLKFFGMDDITKLF